MATAMFEGYISRLFHSHGNNSNSHENVLFIPILMGIREFHPDPIPMGLWIPFPWDPIPMHISITRS